MILSAKYIEEMIVGIPATSPVDDLFVIGKGVLSTPPPRLMPSRPAEMVERDIFEANEHAQRGGLQEENTTRL